MSYMKFKEFVAFKEAVMAAPLPSNIPPSQAVKKDVDTQLKNAQSQAPPPQVDRQVYKAQLQNARMLQQTKPQPTAKKAMDVAAIPMAGQGIM